MIADGDKVVLRATASGRHIGEIDGTAATGAEWSTQQIHIFRLAGEQVIEHWTSDGALIPIARLRQQLQPDKDSG